MMILPNIPPEWLAGVKRAEDRSSQTRCDKLVLKKSERDSGAMHITQNNTTTSNNKKLQKLSKPFSIYCDAARKIAPEYRQQAFCVCAAAKGIRLETVVGERTGSL